MGGRLSRPKAADGMSEIPRANAPPRLTRGRGIINGRTVMAPLTAVIMAGLLFVYSRTSIRAAKLNAQKHREADGGQISWQKESMRRHGQIEKVEDDRGTIKEALMADLMKKKKEKVETREQPPLERSENDEQVRRLTGKKD